MLPYTSNVTGTQAARLAEQHLRCCILRYRQAPHSAVICSLFQEGVEACEQAWPTNTAHWGQPHLQKLL